MGNYADRDTVSPQELEIILDKYLAKDPSDVAPMFIWGPPGIGKSDIVKQMTIKHFADQEDSGERKSVGSGKVEEINLDKFFIDVRLTLADPTRLMGMPAYSKDHETSTWLPPTDVPRIGGKHWEKGVWFLDELASAAPSVQVTAHRAIHDRRIEETIIKPGWHIIAAGNPPSDRTVSYELGMPLANRFMMHLYVRPDIESWYKWAYSHNIHSEIIGYLQWKQGAPLMRLEVGKDSNSFPTPRSWANCSKVLDVFGKDINSVLWQRAVASCVGQGAAMELYGFLKVYKSLPDPVQIMDGKIKMPKYNSDNTDRLWALITSFAEILKGNPKKYASRYLDLSLEMEEKEFGVFMLKLVVGDKTIASQFMNLKSKFRHVGERYSDILMPGDE